MSVEFSSSSDAAITTATLPNCRVFMPRVCFSKDKRFFRTTVTGRAAPRRIALEARDLERGDRQASDRHDATSPGENPQA